MHIELLIEGEIFKRFFLPDTYLVDIEDYTPEQNFNAREKIIAIHLEQIKSKFQRWFASYAIEVVLVFESKMNQLTAEECQRLLEEEKEKVA